MMKKKLGFALNVGRILEQNREASDATSNPATGGTILHVYHQQIQQLMTIGSAICVKKANKLLKVAAMISTIS